MKIKINENEIYIIDLPEEIDSSQFLGLMERMDIIRKILSRELSIIMQQSNIIDNNNQNNSSNNNLDNNTDLKIPSNIKSPTGRLTEEARQYVIQQIKKGFSPNSIAKELGVDKTSTYNIKKNMGYTKKNNQYRGKLTKEDLSDIYDMIKKGKKLALIANEFGVNKSRIYQLKVKFGLKNIMNKNG